MKALVYRAMVKRTVLSRGLGELRFAIASLCADLSARMFFVLLSCRGGSKLLLCCFQSKGAETSCVVVNDYGNDYITVCSNTASAHVCITIHRSSQRHRCTICFESEHMGASGNRLGVWAIKIMQAEQRRRIRLIVSLRMFIFISR